MVQEKNKGLTGIDEDIRGFVGRRNLKFTIISSGESTRSLLTFDLGIGVQNLSSNKAPIWRHCALYGGLADDYKGDIRPGAHVRVTGWLTSSYYKDSDGHFILRDKVPITYETLIVESIEILKTSNDKQLSFSGTGRTS